jgi:hypothetical protein
MGKIKLSIELVPSTCWFSNVRTLLPTKEWDRLRKESYAKANHKCEICGQNGRDQGRRHPVECHEIWEYDDKKKVQKLKGLISLCPHCHMVKHFGRSTAIGQQDVVMKHLETVNGWNHKQAAKYLAEVFNTHNERSSCKWSLDIQILTEKHQVDKKLITEAQKKRS